MTGSFPVADHLRCLASASSDILTDIPFLVTAFWDRTQQINDDAKFSRFFLDWLFERYLKRARGQEGNVA